MKIGIGLALFYSFMILASLIFSGWLVRVALKDLERARRTLGELKTLREARLRRAALRRQTDGDSNG